MSHLFSSVSDDLAVQTPRHYVHNHAHTQVHTPAHNHTHADTHASTLSAMPDRLPVVQERAQDWQTQMATTIKDVPTLLDRLQFEPDMRARVLKECDLNNDFRLNVPLAYVAKMRCNDPSDPLLRQVLPLTAERQSPTGYVTDPLAESTTNPLKGLLHKYRSRVLLTVTGACAIHCRYCFRRHFDYQANLPSQEQIRLISDYIRAHPEVNEVILSGGDPLSLSNRRLQAWLEWAADLPQITTLRIHTRMPLLIPERIDGVLLDMLKPYRCQVVMVIHANHANELDDTTKWHLQGLREVGVTLLNQTVLLKGVNDDVATLAQLSRQLFANGVLPYYLHVLDKVQGAAHFDVDEKQAVALYWQMLAELPGYLVPKLVREVPDYPYKTPVDIYNALRQNATDII